MGHTNSTANLSLPQFIGTDKPTWLGDINGAFSAIDAYAGTNDAAVSGAVSDAASAVSQAASAVSTANNANTTAGNASTAANNAVGVANTANAIAGTVDTKVGLLANLNTTDRTSIVNAINEVLNDGIFELWQNTSLGSFAAQSINITDDNYDSLIVEFGNGTGRGEITIIFEKNGSCKARQIEMSGSGTVIQTERDITSTVSGGVITLAVTDATAYEIQTYGTAPVSSTSNTALVPLRIFGIRHQ